MEKQNFSRRRFIGTGMLAAAGMALASKSSFASAVFAKSKPNSKFNGVQIGVITYSYRSMPGSIQQILQYCIDSNINAVELMGDAAEAYAGAPKRDGSDDFNAKLANWRENTVMDSFFEIRKMFNEAGINIYAWKPNALGTKNTDGEIDYAFNAGKALGCSHVTVELPDALQTQRLGDIAEKHDMMVGYHAHTQATPTLWDIALSQSAHNGINLDIGHYTAGTSSSPVDFILKNHKRILSMHIKDRKFHDGPNMPWGEGDTPIKEVLALMKKNDYKFPATIELEYKIPDGSDAVKEVIKCREYAKNALA
ncbi:sugar phosphate isomerase/epimerase family protein [Mucilaginibacter sp. X4EP1]|uniref:sugar phosphate isomerase/epimerase family protein n=1 Tax=Mucilaginibacter sp. X4EP1 TaxID=2723092 RepID=UPI00216A80EE|nr:sugar phosphate isomerase/epimerase [Mucilaginibacter sp. X4EP1]MCS3812183.1 sugar phosphate isomerase/epimerase [Mucilaginibacter sp. X4EP1]